MRGEEDNIKKRLIAGALALVLTLAAVFAFAACGETPESPVADIYRDAVMSPGDLFEQAYYYLWWDSTIGETPSLDVVFTFNGDMELTAMEGTCGVEFSSRNVNVYDVSDYGRRSMSFSLTNIGTAELTLPEGGLTPSD